MWVKLPFWPNCPQFWTEETGQNRFYAFFFHKCYNSVYEPSRLATWRGEIKELILSRSLRSPTCAVVTCFVPSCQLLISPCLLRTCYSVHLLEAEYQSTFYWRLHLLDWYCYLYASLPGLCSESCFIAPVVSCDWGRSAAAMIIKVVKTAYLSNNQELDERITAHELWALAASWAYTSHIALEDVISAAFWRLSGVFQHCYLWDLAPIADEMSFLGPVVAAQHVCRR